MKKAFMLSSVLAVVMVMSSCNKEIETIADRGKTPGQSTENFVPKGGGTPGDKHNQMATDYLTQYGQPHDNQLTPDEVKTMVSRLATIAKSHGMMDPSADANRVAAAFTQKMQSLGFFDNGFLRTPAQMGQMAVSKISNPNVRNAFNQINTLAQVNDPAFLAKSNAILAGLTGLTPQEQADVDGARSVLNGSHNLWSSRLQQGNPGLPTVTFVDFSYYYEHGFVILGFDDGSVMVLEYEFVSVTFSMFSISFY